MRKVYEYINKVEAELVVVSKSGSTKYKFKFTGGVMDPKNKVHAKHTTDNPIMQRVLETSPYFGKTVRLVATFDTPAVREPVLIKKAVVAPMEGVHPSSDKGSVKAGSRGNGNGKGKGGKTEEGTATEHTGTDIAEPAMIVVEDVTDAGSAASYLLSIGIVDPDISSLEGILRIAKQNNISFPNIK